MAPFYTCIDTFPAFLDFWADAESQPIEEQVDGWAQRYLSEWPELLRLQMEDYAAQNLDWRQIARQKVFPYLPARLPAMQAAHANLLELLEPIFARARAVLGLTSPTTVVIHAGIGCGAGWVTTFQDSPAILFGLENIAECGWSDPHAIAGLIAHEIGHLVHAEWRGKAGKGTGSGPWWQLYEEGFAQVCEARISGTMSGHQSRPDQPGDWLTWCELHKGWLAAEFLRRLDAGEAVPAFFGSWYELGGHSETGYFLGQAVILEMEKQSSLAEIALLEDIKASVRPALEQMAGLFPQIPP
jgi:hypothetical protein